MSRLITALLLIALLASAVHVAQQFVPAIAYAQARDAGVYGNEFSTWAGIEAADTDWIVTCRERWLQIEK